MHLNFTCPLMMTDSKLNIRDREDMKFHKPPFPAGYLSLCSVHENSINSTTADRAKTQLSLFCMPCMCIHTTVISRNEEQINFQEREFFLDYHAQDGRIVQKGHDPVEDRGSTELLMQSGSKSVGSSHDRTENMFPFFFLFLTCLSS